MAIRNKSTLKGFFTTGARPSQGNFEDLIDSYYHKDEDQISQGGWMYRSLFNDLVRPDDVESELRVLVNMPVGAQRLERVRIFGRTDNTPSAVSLLLNYVSDVRIESLNPVDSVPTSGFPSFTFQHLLLEGGGLLSIPVRSQNFDSGVIELGLSLEHRDFHMLSLQLFSGRFRVEEIANYVFYGLEFS